MSPHDRNEICVLEIENLKKESSEHKADLKSLIEKLDLICKTNISLGFKYTELFERMNNRHPKDDKHFAEIDEDIKQTTQNLVIITESLKRYDMRMTSLEKFRESQDDTNRKVFLSFIGAIIVVVVGFIAIKVGLAGG